MNVRFAPLLLYPLLGLVSAPLWSWEGAPLDPALAKPGDHAQARVVLARLIDREPADARHRYNLACIESRLGFTVLALDALESAVRLGFSSRDRLLQDEDLARLREHPRFLALTGTVPASPAPSGPVAAKGASPTAPARNEVVLPQPARLMRDGPVGLFFMTRFWISSGSLEQLVWYFDADGRVYQSPGGGFTSEALERDSVRRGRRSLNGQTLKVTWSDGKVTESAYKADVDRISFGWDAGIFTAVARPDWSVVSGYFEGGAGFSGASGGGTSVSGLTLRADGTFSWSRSASIRSISADSQVTAGSARVPLEGRWKGDGYQLTLEFTDGRSERFVAFPTPDPRAASKVGMLFFNGSMHLPKTR